MKCLTRPRERRRARRARAGPHVAIKYQTITCPEFRALAEAVASSINLTPFIEPLSNRNLVPGGLGWKTEQKKAVLARRIAHFGSKSVYFRSESNGLKCSTQKTFDWAGLTEAFYELL